MDAGKSMGRLGFPKLRQYRAEHRLPDILALWLLALVLVTLIPRGVSFVPDPWSSLLSLLPVVLTLPIGFLAGLPLILLGAYEPNPGWQYTASWVAAWLVNIVFVLLVRAQWRRVRPDAPPGVSYPESSRVQ